MTFTRLCFVPIVGLTVTCALAQTMISGRVAETKRGAVVYAGPSPLSPAEGRVAAHTVVYVQNTGSAYLPILLSNFNFAYVRAQDVQMLRFTWHKSLRSQPLLSRGGDRSSSAVAAYGMQFEGTPYRWGGTDPSTGIDCSGFVQKLFGDVEGIKLPRTAAEQALVGTPIYRLEDLLPGDRLYFWEAKRHMIGHTGVYVGKGYFVHSSMGHHGVATEPLSQKWLKILVAARRS
jgi:cell wall-associated NlpC family hydrolase